MRTLRYPRPPLDPELAAALSAIQVDGPVSVTAELISAFRESAAAATPTNEKLSTDGGVEVQEMEFEAPDGASVPALVLRPISIRTKTAPVIYFIHGGGMIMGNRRTGIEVPLAWASAFGAVVVSVEYRLAPEFPDPTPVEDCYAGLVWLYDHAAQLRVDRERILIAGTSAGGGLAAGVALLARDRQGPSLCGQVLMCPMLDDRNETHSSFEFVGEGLWDRTSNETGWNALLGDRRGSTEVSFYAAPSRAEDLSHLPTAYIDAGSAELFRDEVVDYALRLWRAGTQVELHVWPGGFHTFDEVAPQAALSIVSTRTRAAWVGRVLGKR